jgi:ABC-type spermidine/putrescine transport system permease subunit I
MKLTTTILYCPSMLVRLTEWMLALKNHLLRQQVLIGRSKYGLTQHKMVLILKLITTLKMSHVVSLFILLDFTSLLVSMSESE